MANTVVTKGTAHVHSIVSGAVTGLTVQSYTLSSSFSNNEEITNASGDVVGVRLSDKRFNLSVEGLLPTAAGFTPVIGDRLQFTGNKLTFDGYISQIEDRGEAKGFSRISITAIGYEGFTGASV